MEYSKHKADERKTHDGNIVRNWEDFKISKNLVNDDAINCSSDSDTDGDGILLTTRRLIEKILDLIAIL